MENKPKIRIYDNQFKHSHGGSFGAGDLCIKPTFFDWSWEPVPGGDIAVITEGSFHLIDQVTEPVKIGLILEPPCISRKPYDDMKNPDFAAKFKYVLTYNKELLALGSKFIPYVFGGSWIRPEDWKIYDKTKNISIICSQKREAPGHILRHQVIEQFAEKYGIDVYGRGYKPIDYKLEALKDYRYTIVIENEMMDGWVTEKLIDAFACGTLPIYYGGATENKMFALRGCTFNNMEELAVLLNIMLSGPIGAYKNIYDLYRNRGEVESNFTRADKFRIPEDRIWKEFLQPTFFN